ncbi:hypothetical protein GKO32_21375 [Amycolatopsis sp. RM579]|uniref:HTH luxR-type domain-containing protein n=1 Tax=Amycolatopsis pithecellobii TaxID=664692 RepID=A0A6N7Z6H8_9PSEU|nr:hypothetical protein [Amycolatopsis pithecellobii]
MLAVTGMDLIRVGAVAFTQQSTRLEAVAAGRIWASSDLGHEPDFDRLLDRISMVAGHRAGCAVPIAVEGKTCGAVLLSSSDYRTSWDAVARVITAAAPTIATTLGLGPAPTLRVLVLHQDMLAAEGLARILEQGLDAEVRLVHGPYAPELPESLNWADVVVTDRESPIVTSSAVVIARHWSKKRILAAIAQANTKPVGSASAPGVAALTPRELDLVRELDSGLSYHEIADQLGLTTETVRTYSKSLYAKLDAHSRGQAVVQARRQGLL